MCIRDRAKERLKQLLDESKPKADLTGKLDRFFDMGQKEVALYYPIYRTKEYAAGEARALPGDFFRGCQVAVSYTHLKRPDRERKKPGRRSKSPNQRQKRLAR